MMSHGAVHLVYHLESIPCQWSGVTWTYPSLPTCTEVNVKGHGGMDHGASIIAPGPQGRGGVAFTCGPWWTRFISLHGNPGQTIQCSCLLLRQKEETRRKRYALIWSFHYDQIFRHQDGRIRAKNMWTAMKAATLLCGPIFFTLSCEIIFFTLSCEIILVDLS